jgi:hypothetical protein
MTSLIFGAVYVGHHLVVGHRAEKRRTKNYERWEGLRDEYDEQKRTQRESRSLDLQRTGQYGDPYEERPILTLRDQQEADDARTSWRPQETFTPMHTGAQQSPRPNSLYSPPRGRPQSVDFSPLKKVNETNGYTQHNDAGLGIQPQPTGYAPMRALPAQQTGSAWDDGIPNPIRVRRNFEEREDRGVPGVNRASSMREFGSRGSPGSVTPRSPYAGSSENLSVPKRNASSRSPSIPENRVPEPVQSRDVQPIQHDTPGGRMAELLDGLTIGGADAGYNQRHVSAPASVYPPIPPQGYTPNVSSPFSSGPFTLQPAPLAAPVSPATTSNQLSRDGEKDMEEWWQQKGPSVSAAPARQAGEKDMQEWWR